MKYLLSLLLLLGALNANDTVSVKRGEILASDGRPIVLAPAGGYLNDQGTKGKKALQKYYDNLLSQGKDLPTTIDRRLQTKTEAQLDKAKADLNATEVLAMVMDARSGAILSIASSNRYDPSHIRQRDVSSLTPKFAAYPYEPGAVMMPLVMAIAVDAGKVLPKMSRFARHGGSLKIGAYMIRDDGGVSNDPLTLEDILVESSNIGIAQVAQRTDAKTLHEGLVHFGLTGKSGIDLAKDLPGRIKETQQLEGNIYRANTAFGYGLLVTPMHLLKAYNTFANDGKMLTPHIAKAEESKTEEVLSKKVAHEIKQMLIEVVKRGTAQNTKIAGLNIGGKTGTAHIAKRGKYTNSYHSSFYGFAEDSAGHRYTIGVLVIEPKVKKMHFASRSAAPLFKRIVGAMVEQGLLVPIKPSKQKNQLELLNKRLHPADKETSTTPYHGAKTISPLKDAKVTRHFGTYTDPKNGIKIFNESVTLEPPHTGAEVVAVLDGTVIFAGKSKTLGKVVVVSHPNNLQTVYAKLSHLASDIAVGKKLSKGETIGKVAQALVFQAIQDKKHVDPLGVVELRQES